MQDRRDQAAYITVSPELENYLKTVDFPANKDDMLEFATENDAPDEVLEVLSRLKDRSYNNILEVTKEASKVEG